MRSRKMIIFFAILNSLMIVFSCLYGSMYNSARLDSNLSCLYDFSVKNNDSSFIHSELSNSTDDIDYKKSCTYILDTNRIDSKKDFMEPYIVFSSGGTPISFDLSLKYQSSYYSMNPTQFSGIYTYKDTELMENIALPLLNPEGKSIITHGKNGAKFGCYFPYSLAVKYAQELGLSSTDELVTKNIAVELQYNDNTFLISINNIYLNEKVDGIDLSEYDKEYNKYYDFFQRYNKDSIIVDSYSFSQVCKTTMFCCDFVPGFDRSRALVNRILGGNFADRGCNISFYVGNRMMFPEKINRFCVNDNYVNKAVAIISIVLFAFSAIAYIALLAYCYYHDPNKRLYFKFCFLFAIAIPISLWTFSAIFSALSLPTKVIALSVMTYMSNIFILVSSLSLLAIVLFAFILSRGK